MRVRQQVLSLLLDYPDTSYEKIGCIVHCSRKSSPDCEGRWVNKEEKAPSLSE